MSVDQVPSTIGTVECSESDKTNANLNKFLQPEKWEIDSIGDFLLNLYKRQIISKGNDWIVSKDLARLEFLKFLRKPGNEHLEKRFIERYGKSDIGTLLFRTRFLINTPRGNPNYRIRNMSLYVYRDRSIEDLDKRRQNAISDGDYNADNGDENLLNLKSIKNECKDETEEVKFLNYEGSELQVRKSDFSQEKPGCFVCQSNYRTDLELEEHVVLHSEESNFELAKNLKKFDTSIFKISYKSCRNSHFMCFSLQTRLPKVIIEKIILVQSRSFHFINNTSVPYTMEGTGTFYINSQFFTEFLEQPIIILFYANSQDMRLMEQHHFVHCQPFPIVQMHINSQYLSQESTFEPTENLQVYNPEEELIKALKNDFPTEYLFKIRPDFYDYMAENKKMTIKNMRPILELLLQIEVLAVRRANYLLLQREVKLRKCEEVYSIKIKYLSWSTEIAGGRLQLLPEADAQIWMIEENLETLTVKNNTIFQSLFEKGIESLLEHFKDKVPIFAGRVERVIDGRILFVSEENIPLNKSYIAIVHPSCVNLRHQQRAVKALDTMSPDVMKRFLFPENLNSSALPSNNLVLQNDGIRNDDEQFQAVRNITADNTIDAPYIIIGGPGTGKTAVIVESILHLYIRRSTSKILVVAGTDSACDEIALRLCKVLCKMLDENAIARLYGIPPKQRREKIDELLLEYSNLYGKRHFIPAVNVLHKFRILVCTVKMVGYLSLGGFGKTTEDQSIFTHVFVDNAAGLTVPETLMGIVDILSQNTKLVLAGDLQQPDAIIFSERAKDLGLSVSLFERLLGRDCYRTDANGIYNRSILTKLKRNYRSPPQIMELYNRFYGDNKMTVALKEGTSLCQRWYRMPNPTYPIIFHEVSYTLEEDNDTNDNGCVRSYNSIELQIVLNYVKDLIYNGVDDQKIAQKDIGIITPYKKQALHIQDQLHLRGWYQIEVGLPEDFQGKEKTIVFISFVWSSASSLDILNNTKLLNFMISRAKSLLILVGSSKTLNKNVDLKYIIDECRKNKALEFRNLSWQGPVQHQAISNNNLPKEEEEEEDDDQSDDDDTQSQCSEMSSTGAKKKSRKRNKKNKGVKKIDSSQNMTSLLPNNDQKNVQNAPAFKKQDIGNQNQNNSKKSKGQNNGQNASAIKKQSTGNENQNQNKPKQNQNTKNSQNQYSDDLLNILPNVPNLDTLESEIKERLEKLNLTGAPKQNTTDKRTQPSSSNSKAVCKNQTTTTEQQKKMQHHLNQANVAAGGQPHGQVKRLNHKPAHPGGHSQAKNNGKKGEFNKQQNINSVASSSQRNVNQSGNSQKTNTAIGAPSAPVPPQNFQGMYFQPQPPIVVHMPTPQVSYPQDSFVHVQPQPQQSRQAPTRPIQNFQRRSKKKDDNCVIA